MRRTEPLSIKEIVDKILDDDSNLKDAARQQRLCYSWPQVVGPGVNRYTSQRYIQDRKLHVYLTSASLKNDLQFHRSRLVQMLNEAAGGNVIDDIVIH